MSTLNVARSQLGSTPPAQSSASGRPSVVDARPLRFFFAGHRGFDNRGCEALIRTTAAIVRSRYPRAVFLTPSLHPELDRRQWPQAQEHGVRFIPVQRPPLSLKVWNRCRRVLPALERWTRPSFSLSDDVLDAMRSADCIVMTGGDNISLDYDLPSLYFHAAFIDNAKRLGKRTALWGASVGPFTDKPHVERLMCAHLRDYDTITVRESESLVYLRSLGFERVSRTVDPAFLLDPEPMDVSDLLPSAPEGILGLNFSPLVRKGRNMRDAGASVDREIERFIRGVIRDTGYGVLLIPHVAPLNGETANSDHHYMQKIVRDAGLGCPRLAVVPGHFNAAQTKHVISRCRFFIGARTHATIAAFSTGVPTVSIAYSVKAKGINRDLFGPLPVVLDRRSLSEQTLAEALGFLEREEENLRRVLREKVPEWKKVAFETIHAW